MNGCLRRDFLRRTGTAAVTAAGLGAASAPVHGQQSDSGWTNVDSPTEKNLNSAVESVEGPAVVGDGGDVLVRRKSGWQKVVEYGPQARSRPLTGADVTDDGARLWFVGGSGVIGEYDVTTRTLTNYSAPKGKTSTWEDCAVAGKAGENERLYFVNGSGELLFGIRQDSGAIKYRDVIKPGGGSTIPGIDLHAKTEGHVCSTSQFVAKTTDGGESWTRIGIGFAGGSFFDVASQGLRDVNVAAGSGIIYRYDGFRWTPHVVDDDRQAIRAIDRDGSEGLAAGAGGNVFSRQSKGQWQRNETPVSKALLGVVRTDSFGVAVGDGGIIVERRFTDADAKGASQNAVVPSLSDSDLSVENRVEGEWYFED